jgi:hypothetical protein
MLIFYLIPLPCPALPCRNVGLIVGKHHGIARKSKLVDVRAMDENGFGSTVNILSGLNYIAGKKYPFIKNTKK